MKTKNLEAGLHKAIVDVLTAGGMPAAAANAKAKRNLDKAVEKFNEATAPAAPARSGDAIMARMGRSPRPIPIKGAIKTSSTKVTTKELPAIRSRSAGSLGLVRLAPGQAHAGLALRTVAAWAAKLR